MTADIVKVDLTNCDREPIHIPGSIQPHGAMLVCDPDDGKIMFASANAAAFIGYSENPVGHDLSDAIGETAAHDLRNAAAKAGGSHIAGALLDHSLPGTGDLFNITIHYQHDRLFVELEKTVGRKDAHDALDLTQTIIRRIGLETESAKIAKTAVNLVRATLGYDRVMIYRFLHNGAGQVIAEAKRTDLPSFRNQYFPASDIPVQARRLYLINWIRMIGDVGYIPVPIEPELGDNEPPIDMSYAGLRSVSTIHCEYLGNMGVAASLSISIVIDGELWGLIACHHDTPKLVPLPLRLGAELFGQYLSMQIALAERRTQYVAATQARERLAALISTFSAEESIGDTLRSRLGAFVEMIPCDGVGLWNNGEWAGTGRLPPQHAISDLMEAIDLKALGSIWHTAELRTLQPGGDFGDAVAGVLAIPIAASRNYLLLFRSEEAHNIEWAGEPKKKTVSGPLGDRLSPRGSFETWREEVRGQSQPWTGAELVVAEAIRTYLRDVILRHSEATAEERARTERHRRLLNDELNHRVKNIITLVKSIAIQTGATANSVQDYSALLEGRLRALAYAHDQSLGGSGGDLKVLLEAEASLHRDSLTADRVVIKGPAIGLNDRAFGVIALLMHEMITNAAKYGALSTPSGRLAIHWSITEAGDCAIDWIESGGPPVTAPVRTGFGTKLIQSTISHDLGGRVEIQYASTGLRGFFVVPARYLKDVPESAPVLQQSRTSEAHDLQGMKVMLVEDQALIAMDTEEALRQLGALSVVLMAGSAEAFAALAVDAPDCVVLDYNLGDETSEQIADKLVERGIPFVFATGYGDTVMIPERFAAVPVVRKPVNGAVLAEKLGIVIAPKRPD